VPPEKLNKKKGFTCKQVLVSKRRPSGVTACGEGSKYYVSLFILEEEGFGAGGRSTGRLW